MTSPRILLAALLPAVVFALAACAPTPPPPPATVTVTAPAAATPTPTTAALDADIVLQVKSKVTATNGAILDIDMQVHKSTAWNDGSATDRAALMTKVCDGSLDKTVYKKNLWSFAKVDVTATADPASKATWPSAQFKRLRLQPATTHLAVVSSGDILVDQDVDQATPFCKRDHFLHGVSSGTLVVGFQGDTDAVGAAGGYTRWANHTWGFMAREVGGQTSADTGMTVSDCSYTVPDAGKALHGGKNWSFISSDTACYVGTNQTEDDDS